MAFDPPIDGQTPIDDLSGLRLRGVRTQGELNVAEASNIRRAMMRYLAARPSRRRAPFDAAWMVRLHREMFGRVWSWAGAVRRRELNIGSPPHRIEVELHELAADLAAWQAASPRQSAMPLHEQAARLHHRAVRIHPFMNGNGRWARLLANIWLARAGAPLVEWPESTVGTESPIRADYLRAVRAADAGDLAPLVGLHARFTPGSATRSRSSAPPRS